MSPRVRNATVVLALAAVVACKRTPVHDAGPEREAPLERTRLAAPRPIASSSAFDLAPVADGAVLVWGRPGRLGGGVLALRLDEYGGSVGHEVPLFVPSLPPGGLTAERIAEDALEVDATAARGALAVVWIARDAMVLTAKSLVGDVATLRAAAPNVLGVTERTTTAGRGSVAVATEDDGSIHALVRLGTVPCADGATGPCIGIGHAELRPTGVHAVGSPLAVPAPCPVAISGIASVGTRFHYGVCSTRTGQPVTTVYTIETEPSLARTEDILPGCATDGFVVAGDELLVPGRCAGGRAGARIASGAQSMRAMPMENLAVRCDHRVPIITTEAAIGATIRLENATDRLESMLPESVAPVGSRAVFTGSTVVVAQPIGGEVAVHRFGCEEGEFRQIDFF